MYLRYSKIILVFLVGIFALLVAFNNITDYNSNFQFVQHVLMMDTTFEGNALMWRAIDSPWVHELAYAMIIFAEALVGVLCVIGAVIMLKARQLEAKAFSESKAIATYGLVLGITLWFGGFMTVGAEWFLMWQSGTWNGQGAAFRFIMIIFATLIFLNQQEPE